MDRVEFRVATYMETGKPMVEVWKDGVFIAGIYGHEDGMRIVSKYFDGVQHETGIPSSVVIKFSMQTEKKKGGTTHV